MKSLSERRIAAEDRLNEIEDEIDALKEKIKSLQAEYAAIEPVWQNLMDEEGNELRRLQFDPFAELGAILTPII